MPRKDGINIQTGPRYQGHPASDTQVLKYGICLGVNHYSKFTIQFIPQNMYTFLLGFLIVVTFSVPSGFKWCSCPCFQSCFIGTVMTCWLHDSKDNGVILEDFAYFMGTKHIYTQNNIAQALMMYCGVQGSYVYYNDVTWVSCHLISPSSWLFAKQFVQVQAGQKENIKALHYMLSCEEKQPSIWFFWICHECNTLYHTPYPWEYGLLLTIGYSLSLFFSNDIMFWWHDEF